MDAFTAILDLTLLIRNLFIKDLKANDYLPKACNDSKKIKFAQDANTLKFI